MVPRNYKFSTAQKERMSLSHKNNPKILGKNNSQWKGDRVGYNALHAWIIRRLGRPKKCANCLTEKATWYEWANISGEYKRDVSDWKRLCRSCHMNMDGRIKNLKYQQ